jgi:iron-sulfur cluster repair protein YtfE (RIC family)
LGIVALLHFSHSATVHETGSTPEEKLTKHDGQKKQDIFNQIRAALEVHATIEEEIFYPAVKKARSENVKDEVREAYEEHKQIKSLLAQISSITSAEGEMFPDAKKFLGEHRLIELALNWNRAKSSSRQL